MQLPQELNTLLGKFHLDSFVDRDEIQAIEAALRQVGQGERYNIRRYLKVTLAGPYEPGVLLDRLWASPADVVPEDADGAVRFLELIRDSIDDEGRIVRPF